MLRFIACNGSGVCFRVASSTRTLVKSHSTTGNLVEKLFLLLQQWSSAMSSPRYGFYVHFGASVIDSSEISHSLSRFSSYMIFHIGYIINDIFFKCNFSYFFLFENLLEQNSNKLYICEFVLDLWYLHYNFTVFFFLPLSLNTYNFNLRD